MHRQRWFALIGLVAFCFLAMGADSCETDSGGGGGDGGDKSASGGKKKAKCGITATDDCTPHVGPKGKVRVDALVWRVLGVQTASTLGDVSLGAGAKADGVFVIVNLKVTSRKDESATLTDESVQLQQANRIYKADNDGTVAAIGAGQEPLFLEDISPDATVKSKVVFDVPPSVLKRNVEVRLNELGFGDAHGYIRLPATTTG